MLLPTQEQQLFWDTFDRNFPYAGRKPHVLFLGRMEGELMAGCGADATALSGASAKVVPTSCTRRWAASL